MSGSKVVVTIRVEPETRERLRDHAYLTGEAVNETVGRLITAYLDGPGQEQMNEIIDKGRPAHRAVEPRVSARDLLGIAPDWTGPLSTEEYVAEQRGGS